ncbi:hypothetical protein MTX26_27445 [Bradyrhizobium sp. ISRA443]|uniref:hypothetical protein n=1 Tax=unclassified Bradyrhizobium TaxID=2631580 RepID=UPI002478BBA0|nr:MULTISPECIES: hypothetical protein [unclassified Bradyrhizobium]WGR93458.1 hypothetical protein MTX20_02280 [Bradyrhizobium sp. ISRA435]WGR98006.1 hypothetical protein MTX23_27435 [Bradyrhizobium sp. ISRA436]WGS04896.1 hypothetical protein MTX18_27445 [Bradyrhizobium sp. ISRA437]WGS11779.1 hypothetical protein MTX26_27445 [Bradyrhizobium sp. ISRA443]
MAVTVVAGEVRIRHGMREGWPRIGHHRVQMNPARLMALVDRMDWVRQETGKK